MIVRWTRRAVQDVTELRSYIARDSPSSADSVAQRLLDAAETLTDYPERGRPGRRMGTRELVVARTPYVVAYRVRREIVVILRVLHGAQRWPLV